MAELKRRLVCEIVGGEPYEYYPLGEHIVCAPGVCGGESTFKYTRIGVHHAIELLSGGRTVEQVARSYEVPVAAVQEALLLSVQALTDGAPQNPHLVYDENGQVVSTIWEQEAASAPLI